MTTPEEREDELKRQEVYVKMFFDGYFFSFLDQMLAFEIRVENPDFPEKDAFKGTTYVLCPENANNKGEVDLTPLLHALAAKMAENPGKKVKAYATGFTRQFHFDKNLLSTPIPEGLLKLFVGEKDDKGLP
jgi:hypothetical protein